MLNLLQQFLNLDQTYNLSFPGRSIMWVAIACFLWFLLIKFTKLPGNGGKYLWQLILTPSAIFFTFMSVVDYSRGLGVAWAELLFIPAAIYLVCLLLITRRLLKPHYPTMLSETDIEELSAITAFAAKQAAETTKLAADKAVETAEHASRVADIAHKAAIDVKLAAKDAREKLVSASEVAALKVENKAKEVASEISAELERKD